jgi:ArsR family transcriptional regulator, lead/cadmium/zinc/bismuth-responsive transcriptional repressor
MPQLKRRPGGNGRNTVAMRKEHLDTDTLISMTETFRVLGDITRLKICLALSRQELCVGEIADLLNLTDSAVSHQLRMMKTMRLVRYRRAGKMSYYTLDDEHIEQLISLGLRHVSEN